MPKSTRTYKKNPRLYPWTLKDLLDKLARANLDAVQSLAHSIASRLPSTHHRTPHHAISTQTKSRPPDTESPARRRQTSEPESSAGAASSGNEDGGTGAPTTTDALVKKMVRLALASEYARLTIRRGDISAKVLGEQGVRQFKTVFEAAQRELRTRFGMEMTELPAREKVTVTQRRGEFYLSVPALGPKSRKTLQHQQSLDRNQHAPPAYRTPAILTPPKAPSSGTDSTYTALYTFLIAVISLNGGSLAEQKLERYLARTNADTYTPIDRTDRLLQRLCREGYLIKTREMDGGEEVVEYMVGPRGKVEVGSGGVAGLVRRVYGRDGGGDDDGTMAEQEIQQEFEARLGRSLGVVGVRRQAEAEEEGQQRRQSQAPRRSSRRAAEEEEDEEESDDEEDSD
ncbi:hypothetical protein NUU61_008997 [Penicillium alfredii]|uniref:MAGE domain-containing protein n=1 Tax=Penicillium alfredii TaxID=1506179 RepID=A0A9W9JWR2_9EURO|nr:uncharacterized protein NUU61_008997 [Penicillium alfredii]KAJ5084418.1 hypothetical protein NUU61_008997 [Penicillium alfredii]